jgi:hypothetical protein
LAHGYACCAELALAEVIASRIVVVILDLLLFEGEIAGMALVGEIMPIGVAAASSIRTGVWHVVAEESVMAGYSTPAQGRNGTQVMGVLTMGGQMVVLRAIGAALALFELLLGQGVICGVLAVPGDSTTRPSSESGIGSCHYVGVVGRGVVPGASVLPCQFTSLFVLLHELKELVSHVSPNEPLPDSFGSAYIGQLVQAELGPSLLCESFKCLNLLQAEGKLSLVCLKGSEAYDVRLHPVVA